jgi:hypothetical protein
MRSDLAWTVLVNSVIVERDCPSLLRGSAMNQRFAAPAACSVVTVFATAALPDDAARVRINESVIMDPVEDDDAAGIVRKSKACIVLSDESATAPISRVFLYGNKIGDDEFGALERLPFLRSLLAIGMPAECARSLGRLRQLEKIQLRDAELGSSEIKAIAGLPRLRSLSFYRCGGITDAAIAEIAKSPRLDSLGLRGGREFTHVGLKELRRLKTLKKLTWI